VLIQPEAAQRPRPSPSLSERRRRPAIHNQRGCRATNARTATRGQHDFPRESPLAHVSLPGPTHEVRRKLSVALRCITRYSTAP